jgi:uncharacterized protein
MERKGIARRNFLKMGTAVAASTLVAPTVLASGSSKTTENDRKLIYRKLGNTGIELPIVSMGVMRSDNPQVVEAGLKAGIRHFDTAAMYQDGKNEEMLGRFFKDVPRNSFTIATKVHPGRFNAYDNKAGILKDNFEAGFNETFKGCLDRLQMDYVDILYIHAIEQAHVAFDERVLKVLQQAKDQGKAKHLAISTHRPKEILQGILDNGFYEVVMIAINAKNADDMEYLDLIRKVSEKGVGIVAMKTMMGGYYDKEKTKKVNGKAALKWVLQKEYIHTSIPGMKTFEEVEENVSVMENLEFNEDEKANLELAFNETGMYCTQCETCLGQCKKGLDIPGMMRAYMYAYGYGETRKAKDQLLWNRAESLCTDCGSCTVNCRQGFHVAEKIKDIARLANVPDEFLV